MEESRRQADTLASALLLSLIHIFLSKAEWDKEQLIRDLREEWGIVDEEPDEGDEDDENSDDACLLYTSALSGRKRAFSSVSITAQTTMRFLPRWKTGASPCPRRTSGPTCAAEGVGPCSHGEMG